MEFPFGEKKRKFLSKKKLFLIEMCVLFYQLFRLTLFTFFSIWYFRNFLRGKSLQIVVLFSATSYETLLALIIFNPSCFIIFYVSHMPQLFQNTITCGRKGRKEEASTRGLTFHADISKKSQASCFNNEKTFSDNFNKVCMLLYNLV